MNDIQSQKKELRLAYKARRRELDQEYRRDVDRAIRETVLASAFWKDAERVFLYVSMWEEPDTRALIETALREGKRVYVPLCCPDRVMKAIRIRRLDELRPGMLNIPEPPAENEAAAPGELSLAVVPCVTATAEGARLGYGGGYYDRFLQLHRCPTICLCYGRILAETLPTDRNDVRMDVVITENGAIKAADPFHPGKGWNGSQTKSPESVWRTV